MDNRSQRTGSSWGSVLEDSVGWTWMDLGAFDLEDETSVVRSDVPQECLTEQNLAEVIRLQGIYERISDRRRILETGTSSHPSDEMFLDECDFRLEQGFDQSGSSGVGLPP